MNSDQQEYVGCCNLCGADNPKLLFGTHQIPGGKMGGVVRCRACGLVYRNVRQKSASIRRYFEQGEDADLSPDWIAGRKELFNRCLKLLEPFRQCNRILDVGAGQGFFLSACAKRGWDCYGVETSRRAVDYAQRNFGLSLSCGAFEEAAYPDEYFDAVTFLNVLEFLPDPKGALQKTRQKLRPGGAVMVRFSNASFHVAAYRFFLFLGRRHRKLNRAAQAVIHLYAFDKDSMTRLFLESGFTDIRVAGTPLSWTTKNEIRIIGFVKRLTCRLIYLAAWFISLASFRRLLICPSLMVIARKGSSRCAAGARAEKTERERALVVEEIHDSQRDEWNAFVGPEMHGHFFQSWEWGDFKSKRRWRPIRLAVRRNGRITAAIQVLKLKIPLLPLAILYAPRGPIVDYNDETAFACLLSGIAALAQRERVAFLQIDPDISKANVAVTSCLARNGFIAHMKYGVVGLTLPTRVFRLNVRKDDQELLANMGHKHRQYIRLSLKKGVSVQQGNSVKELETFYAILKETSRRKNFIIHSYKYMKSLYDQFAPYENIRLFFAMFQEKPVAARLVIAFGDKCWDMYAGMLGEYHNLRASYLLVWEILKWARDNGYTWFDFRGTGRPDPASVTHGIYMFKKGFGPDYIEFIGDHYLVFSKPGFSGWNLIKFMLRNSSKSLRAYHTLLNSLNIRR